MTRLPALICLLILVATSARADSWAVEAPAVVLAGVPTEVTVAGPDDRFPVVLMWPAGQDTVPRSGAAVTVRLQRGDQLGLTTLAGADLTHTVPRVLPGWTAILPPLLAILLALLTRQVLVSLVLGGWIGCLMLEGWQPLAALLRLGDRFLVEALAQPDHASIVLFTTILGGMVGVMARGGLTEGVVKALVRKVGGRRGGQLTTAGMGTMIFFDDYANTLLVGTTMRPLTDRLRISREKLSYLVDSTAAPVATLAVISTWVGFEVGLIQDALAGLGSNDPAYTFFLRSLPYSFYPWLTLLCVYMIAATGRDFGPMRAAEQRALSTGAVLRPGARPASESLTADDGTPSDPDAPSVHPVLGLLPVITVVATTAIGLVMDGRRAALESGLVDPGLRDMLGLANSFAVLMWAAIMGTLAALLVVVALRRLNLRDAMDGFVDGCRAMLIAVTILLLAWSLSAVCEELNTAGYLVDACRGALSARLLPAVTFLLAAMVSFATGTSWGTMAILMPLVFPLGAILPEAEGLAASTAVGIHLAATSAVLAGAVFGDHCSPISDTTIMSSLATGSDHIDHVRTQLPYAMLVGLLALVCGYLPVGWGMAPWISLALGAVLVIAAVFLLGRRVEARGVNVVVLISDFGLTDTYVAEMKAALLRLGPGDLTLVDATHDLPAGDVAAGRWVLSHLWRQFPAGAVFLTVIDPGVGTDRPAIAARADGRWFVGPGNGLAGHLTGADALVVRRLTRLQPPPGHRPATTFAGRDLFAPAAAHLVGGGDPADLGPAGVAPDLGLATEPGGPPQVVWVDRFGNLVTDLARDSELGASLAAGAVLLVAGEPVAGPREHYAGAPAGTLFWYWGSRDTLEVAVDGSSAAGLLGAKPGLVISASTS